jgi:subtilisin
MTALRPAYSAPFTPEGLHMLSPTELIGTLTREWAWEGATGRGVKVAVIDSGIDATHPLVGGPVKGYVKITEEPDGLNYDTEPHDDDFGHGTACAGIIRGIVPDCDLYSIKVLGAGLTGRGIIFAAGLRWAIEQGIHVCNLSLSTSKSDFFGVFHELVDLAYFRNVAVVSAMNNLPRPSFPSQYASVFSVASHAVPDPYHFYYNHKPPVEFGALGMDVRVAWQHGETITATGNSFAAPHITGIIAKLLSKHPGLTVFQIKGILQALASNVRQVTAPDPDIP